MNATRWTLLLITFALALSLHLQPITAQTTPTPTPTIPTQFQTIPTGGKIAIIDITGLIYGYTVDSLKERSQQALADGATIIVIRLDTPGGVVTDAIDAAKHIKSLPVPTIAWVDRTAYSAGALLATACDHMVVSPASSIGDSAPVALGQNLAPTERLKALSPVLAEYKDNARDNGYDYAPLHAMCVPGVEVYLVEHDTNGQRKLVNQVDYAVMVDGLPPSEADARLAPPVGDPNAAAAATRQVAEQIDMGRWKPVTRLPSGATAPDGRVHDGQTLLTFNQTEVVDTGLAVTQVADAAALQAMLGSASATAYAPPTLAQAGWWLTRPWVRGILVLLLVVGAWLELSSPGLGIPGVVAFIALCLLIGAPLSIGLGHLWHVLLFVAGLGLLIVELILLPTAGILGVVGVLMMLLGVTLAVIPTSSGAGGVLPAPGMSATLLASTTTTFLAFVASLISVGVLIRYFDQVPGMNRLILTSDTPSEDEQLSTPDPRQTLVPTYTQPATSTLPAVGSTGTTTTTLKPAGKVRINGEVHDAHAQHGYIDANTPIRVTETRRSDVVVEHA